ncbi:SMI1/KNR4 family protein [Streptomyces sp. NPDC056910]|uniref:SMI1/KNR4 family protein n=1 Tax=Streptomyces sp. NPDC056910 TaxID=3345964 RepID=UPI0036B80CAE
MTPDLTRLTELLPRPQDSGQVPDWNAAESTLQTALPADYKELIEAYGGGGFIDGYLLLLEPGCRNDVYDLIKISAEREEANDSLWQYEDKPVGLEAEDSRLICWATTDNGEYLYWLVQRRPRHPSRSDQRRVWRGLGTIRRDRDPLPRRRTRRTNPLTDPVGSVPAA